jgi:hypothetical protein
MHMILRNIDRPILVRHDAKPHEPLSVRPPLPVDAAWSPLGGPGWSAPGGAGPCPCPCPAPLAPTKASAPRPPVPSPSSLLWLGSPPPVPMGADASGGRSGRSSEAEGGRIPSGLTARAASAPAPSSPSPPVSTIAGGSSLGALAGGGAGRVTWLSPLGSVSTGPLPLSVARLARGSKLRESRLRYSTCRAAKGVSG